MTRMTNPARRSLASTLQILLIVPIALFVAWGLSFAQPAQAQTCIDDVTERTNVCTANDVHISLVLNETDVACEAGSTVDLSLTAVLEATASERWDIGMFVATDGGDARTGVCHQDFLPPPLSAGGTCSIDGLACTSALGTSTDGCLPVGLCDDGLTSCNTDIECPVPTGGGTCFVSGGSCIDDLDCFGAEDPCVGVCGGGQECNGGYDPVAGLGPFFNGEDSEDPGDTCGDLEQSVPTYYQFVDVLTVPCADNDGDGRVDIGSCVSWDNARSAGTNNKPSCEIAADTEPNTKSKCRCETQNIGNVFVAGKIIVDKVTDPAGSALSFDFTTNYGDAFSLTDAADPNDSGPLVPTAISGSTYSVSEILPDGWALTDVTCTGATTDPDGNPGPSVDKPDAADIELLSGETVTCVFTNTLQRGNIIVDKVTDPPSSTQSFGFTTNFGQSFSLTDAEAGYDSGDLVPSSEAGTYSVTETAVAGWDLTSAVCDDGSDPSNIDLDPGETVTCTFTNTIQRGRIIVDKVTDPPGSLQSFDFTTNYGTGFSLADADPSNDSGDLLPSSEAGSYSVTEAAVSGWELTSASCSDGSDPDAIDLAPGETVTCTFYNEQDAKIIVEKLTNPAGSTQLFDFTSDYGAGFQLGDGDTNESVALDPGTYAVSETLPAGWELASATCDDGSDPASIDLQAGETVTCTFNNEQDAFIVIEKQTDPDGSTQLFDFTSNYGAAFQLSDGQTNTSGALDPGSYSVSEPVSAGWELTSATCDDGSDPASIDLQAGETVTCTFNNEQDAFIVIEKQTDPDGSTQLFQFSASYDADGFSLSDGQTNTSGALDPGSYSVSESLPAGWELTSATCDDGSPLGSISLQAGETVTCTFNNEQDAFIVIEKQTDPDGSTQQFDFSASYDASGFSLSDGQTNTSVALDPGSYSVSETLLAGWELTSAACDDGSNPTSIDLQAGETVTCTFNNEQDAFIVIEKQTDPDGSTQQFDFSASYDANGFSLSDGQTNTSGALDPGSYSVSETLPVGWELTSAACDDGSDPASIDLQAGETVTCTFNNEQDAFIVIEKQTDPDGSTQQFDFSASYDANGFSLSDGQTNTSGALDPGSYSVSETLPVGWELTSAACDDGSDPASIDLQAGETVTCTFNNEQDAFIIIEKQTDPDGSTQQFDFSASYDANGFSLSDGQTNTSGALDPGTYSVSETLPADWDLTSASCDDASAPSAIDLQAGETVTCTFNNRERGMVDLVKLTNGVEDPNFTWSFTLNGPDVSVSDSTPPTLLDFDQAKLIPGETYTLCETGIAAGWTLQWNLDVDGNSVFTMPPDQVLPFVGAQTGNLWEVYDPTFGQQGATNDTRCVDFTVGASETVHFIIDNQHPGGDARTIGFWKNWNTCTNGHQAETAEKNGGQESGFYILDDLLPQLIGDFAIETCEDGVSILDKSDLSGRKRANDAAYDLAAQLLAAKLNLSAGAQTCAEVLAEVAAGDALLSDIGFDGYGRYFKPNTKDPLQNEAYESASLLDLYNNNELCGF